MTTSALDDAYERFRGTGPEWGGNLSNHGPMAVEVLARRGFSEAIDPWVAAYLPRLDQLPRAGQVITEATLARALGDFGRVGDWTDFFRHRLEEQPWRAVLATWWPRLLPGIAAGATHGLIRTSHATRALLAGDDSAGATAELGAGLAFWAARSTRVPAALPPAGTLDAGKALAAVPRITDQSGPLAGRFDRLADLEGWPAATAALRPADGDAAVVAALNQLVAAATSRYLRHGYGSPVLLVHTATAPNAVLHTLPALPEALWAARLAAVWSASAAIAATYGPARPADRADLPAPPRSGDPVPDLLDQAVAHGDAHVIKFTDTAVEVHAATGDPDALAAAELIRDLIRPST